MTNQGRRDVLAEISRPDLITAVLDSVWYYTIMVTNGD